jgi:hypothetical protein
MHYLLGVLWLFLVVWLSIDAIRQREWLWLVIMWVFPGFGVIMYFLHVYRGSTMPALEWPGSGDRRRIRELEGKIINLDKAHHHAELGTIYLRQGKIDRAEECFRMALERDSSDIDIRAGMGQCLLQLKRFDEASAMLKSVCNEDPGHDYSNSLIMLAEAYAGLDREDEAIAALQRVLQSNSYPRARVSLAELHLKQDRRDLAEPILKELMQEMVHIPRFQEKRDRKWYFRAQNLLRRI